jgi:hypothetical protein
MDNDMKRSVVVLGATLGLLGLLMLLFSGGVPMATEQLTDELGDNSTVIANHVTGYEDTSATITYTAEVDGSVVVLEKRVFDDVTNELETQIAGESGRVRQRVYQTSEITYFGEINENSTYDIQEYDNQYALATVVYAPTLEYYIANGDYIQTGESNTYTFSQASEGTPVESEIDNGNVTNYESTITVDDEQRITQFAVEFEQSEDDVAQDVVLSLDISGIGESSIPEQTWIEQ